LLDERRPKKVSKMPCWAAAGTADARIPAALAATMIAA
jgi:hypothetical protein